MFPFEGRNEVALEALSIAALTTSTGAGTNRNDRLKFCYRTNSNIPEVSQIIADIVCISKLFKSLNFQGK